MDEKNVCAFIFDGQRFYLYFEIDFLSVLISKSTLIINKDELLLSCISLERSDLNLTQLTHHAAFFSLSWRRFCIVSLRNASLISFRDEYPEIYFLFYVFHKSKKNLYCRNIKNNELSLNVVLFLYKIKDKQWQQ